MFSQRTAWNLGENALSAARRRREAAGLPILDLCESNPTQVGLSPTWQELAPLLAHPGAARYAPEPLGLAPARLAVAQLHGMLVPPERVVLTASTSEAYSWLFKLLCNHGDSVLIPTPSYPLFDYLAGLEGVRTETYPLHLVANEWWIDTEALNNAWHPRVKAVLVVSPANPTGSAIRQGEAQYLQHWCADRGLALVCDEVFADTLGICGADVADRQTTCAGLTGCLTVVLSGLSKVCLVPQLKLAWMLVSGPDSLAAAAMERLELMADTYLSAATPVQLALPGLLALRPDVQARLARRVCQNRQTLSRVFQGSACTVLGADGGWSALLRLPRSPTDEQRTLALLERHGLVVQPGWYFDLPGEGWLVVGLLQPPELFAVAAEQIAETLSGDL